MGQIIDPINAKWVENIYEIEETDPVKGGKEGIANRQAQQLAERTAFLRAMFDRLFLGRPFKSWDRAPRAGFIRYDGSIHQRANYAKLVKYATDENLFVSQSLKDGDPLKYAAYFGDGDGETTFTTPNGHLGNVFRGASEFGSFLESQGDAIRNLTGSVAGRSSTTVATIFSGASGSFVASDGNPDRLIDANHLVSGLGDDRYVALNFDASRQVPVAEENRMKSSNINIDAWAGE